MPSVLVSMKELQGFIPNLDRRKVSQPYIINGSNFLWGLDGPYSGLGYSLFASGKAEDDKLGEGLHIGGFEIGDDKFIFCANGVYKFNEITREYGNALLSWVFPEDKTPAEAAQYGKWSMANVGRDYFFAHIGLGDQIVHYDWDEDTEVYTWKLIDTNVPEGARAVTSYSGRLVILGKNQYTWSALDQGANLEPSLTTGAGAQGLSIVGGDGLTLTTTQNGVYIITSLGIIKANFTGGQAVFNHRVIHSGADENPFVVVNQFCVANIDEYTTMILTTQGLLQGNGGIFKLYEPIMSDYLANTLQNVISPERKFLNYALWYDKHRTQLWVSIKQSDQIGQFDYALLLHTKLNKWGKFDEVHKGFFVLDQFLIVNALSQINVFNLVNHRARRIAGVDSGLVGLNSYVQVGLLRPIVGERSDEVSYVDQLSISAGDTSRSDTFEEWGQPGEPGTRTYHKSVPQTAAEDYNEASPWYIDDADGMRIEDGMNVDVDFADGTRREIGVIGVMGMEDWGFNVSGVGRYIVRILSGYDAEELGRRPRPAGLTDQEAEDELVASEGNNKLLAYQVGPSQIFYSAHLVGFYYVVEIATGGEAGNFYDLNQVELSVMPSGYLSA